MIDLKDRPDLGWNTLLTLSLVGVVAAAWFQLGFQALSPTPPETSPQRDQSHLRGLEDNRKAINAHVWHVSMDDSGPAALDYLTSLCEKNSVQLTSFRTDKANAVALLDEAPFVAIVEGAFPDVLAFAHKLEGPGSKLAVNLLELSASDTAPGHVTATFGLLGFFSKEAK